MPRLDLPKPLRGVIPPLVTPLLDRDTIDAVGLARLIEHVLAGGVHGLFILGTTGEGPSLSYGLRRELIERTCRHVNRRVPVLVGVTDTSAVESLKLARSAETFGATALVLSTPYYFPLAQDELLEHLTRTLPEMPLPVFLYNMPSHTKVSFELDTVRRVLDLPNLAGLKDSSGNMLYFHKVREILFERTELSLLMGPEELLADGVLAGGHGGVCGGANLCPRLFVELYQAAARSDLPRVAELREVVLRMSSALYRVGAYGSSFLAGLKCALSCVGICDDFLAEPLHRFRAKERDAIRQHLADLHLETWIKPAVDSLPSHTTAELSR